MFPQQPPTSDNHAHAVQLAVGSQHALLLTDEGIVYSWGGSNACGQLGRSTSTPKQEREPSPITDLRAEIVVQIACGANHCLALSQSGSLFAWGHNKAGQLGLPGFNPNAPVSALIQKTPAPVPPFINYGDAAVPVRSCSCGPESSACISLKGEVYVWGAISYHFFGKGTKYGNNENCTVPVKVRGVPRQQLQDFCCDQVSLHTRQLACTIGRASPSDDLLSAMASLKSRSSRLSAIARSKKQAVGRSRAGEDGGLENEEMRNLGRELRQQKAEYDKILAKIKDERHTCWSDLQRIGRDLTICDQQETALTEYAGVLEVRRGDATGGQQTPADAARRKTLDTQLSDVKYFKASNKKTRMNLLTQRDKLEQQLLNFDKDAISYEQQKKDVEGRERLIKSLQRGGQTQETMAAVDEGLDIAMSKREELGAADPQILAGAGDRFTGLREVLNISDRALQDVSSALKEISSVSGSAGGSAVVEALEANIKLRKELSALVHEKLAHAERGRSAGVRGGESPGMMQFFQEVRMDPPDASPVGHSLLSLTGRV